MNNLIDIMQMSPEELQELVDRAMDIIANPAKYADALKEYFPYLSYIVLGLEMNVGIVQDVASAIAHINARGSHHSDAIVTADADRAAEFLRDVDSACVYHNASTRFTDGAEFGMGAEIGISTDKLHARGPMGLEELTTYKYVVTGDGTVRG